MFSILNTELTNKGFYINLKTSKDRTERVENQIEKFKIKNLERFEALTDPFRQYSCTKSHLSVFELAKNLNLETISVFEDDMDILENPYILNEKFNLEDILKDLKLDMNSTEWDVILLGCNPKSYLIPETKTLSRVYKTTGGWAYLINKKAYEYILENSNYHRDLTAIDDWLPKLSEKNFKVFATTPLIVHHGKGLVSTLQPNGLVDYTRWIDDNYYQFLYEFKKNESMELFVNEYSVERNITVVITGHFVDNFLHYLRYLLKTIPKDLIKCKFLIIYDTNHSTVDYRKIHELQDYFKNRNQSINYEIIYSKAGLIDSVDIMLKKLTTDYFVFLEHDWIFLEEEPIDFKGLVNCFEKYNFVNSVWFNKDDNQLRGFEIGGDVDGKETPYGKEERILDFELTTTIRWSNNPSMLRTSKYKEWYDKYIYNPNVGINHQGQFNVEDSMIREYRDLISKSKWDDIKDDWGTYLYGKIGTGPYIGHTDGSRRYQTNIRTMAEDNADKYVSENPLRHGE
jgi:GR25 family glycosyltransferase involved in LPS biosynthesis